jgi:cephalosporin-C deacetylase
MRMRSLLTLLLAAIPLAGSPLSAAPKIAIDPDRASGTYQPGEKVTWTVAVLDGTKPLAGSVQFDVKQGGLKEIAAGKADLVDGKATITSTRADAGTLLLKVRYKPAEAKEISALGGAAFAPEKIAASAPPPDDFDGFWKAKIAAMQGIPMNVQLTPVDIGDPKVAYFKFTLDHVNGSKVYGQLAKPVGKKDLPALLQVQWAGVYGLQKDWILHHARNGWLAVNISAHDLPIDEKPEFYQKASKELNDYPGIGNDNRDTSYFLRMFLSCRRATDFIEARDDWNGKTLVVHGGSQGGYQAFVTAGLCPKVTAMAASVPAGCDHTGKAAGREPGWPNWASRTWQKKDEKKMLEAARYFDAMNFATRVKCPALVGLGLVDPVCPAEGIFATCNQLKGPKEVIIMPKADHGGDHKAYNTRFGKFLEEQKSK